MPRVPEITDAPGSRWLRLTAYALAAALGAQLAVIADAVWYGLVQ